MTFVVIFSMIAFVGGVALQQIMSRIGAGAQTVAYFGEKDKITSTDIRQARSDLEVLRLLIFDRLLYFGLPDLSSKLLGQLLFPDSRRAAEMSDNMKRAVFEGRVQMSTKDIDMFFSQTIGRAELLWILLKAEAKKAGCITTKSQAKQILKQIVPQLTQGQLDAKQLVDNIIKNRNVPERDILRIVADLWAIITYTKVITDNETVTISEVRAAVGREGEKIDAEFVKINASDFVADQPEPTPQELAEHFERYKEYPPHQMDDNNLYGFGYKQPARIAIEYLVLKLDDAKTLITEPTPDETEAFYQQNLDSPDYQSLFKYNEPTDPNDPASGVQKTRSYADVAGQIRRIMIQDKTKRQADMILNEAIELTELGFAVANLDQMTDADSEKLAGNYREVAAKLSEKYKITIHTGQTGMLSTDDVAADKYLSRLVIEGQNQKLFPLGKVLFALDELGAAQPRPLGVPGSKMWQNIGPVKDVFGSIIGIVRVIRAENASVPADLNVTYNTNGVVIDESDRSDSVYSVKDKVAEDIKLQKAMRQAGARADELKKLIDAKGGWIEALNEINRLYVDPNSPFTALHLEKITQQTRLSDMDIHSARDRSANSPTAAAYVKNTARTKILLDKLYSLIPEGKSEATDLRAVFEFKPDACYYVVKDVSRTSVTDQDYHQNKGQVALTTNTARAERLLLIHLSPDNIFKRMNYRPAAARTDSDKQQPTGAS